MKKCADLHHAVHCGSWHHLQELCEKGGIDLNMPMRQMTPLSLAVQKNDLLSVRILLQNGANVNQRSEDHISRIEPPIVTACRLGNTNILRCLIEYDADLDAKDFYGNTALCMAVRGFRMDYIELLIEKGAKVNCAETFNECPLYLASQYRGCKRNEMVRRLVESGIDANHMDYEQKNSMYWTLKFFNKDLFRFLVLSGAKIKPWPWLTDRALLPQGVVQDPTFLEWLETELYNPPLLQRLCRTEIRGHLSKVNRGRDIRKSVEKLPLPPSLVKYMQLLSL